MKKGYVGEIVCLSICLCVCFTSFQIPSSKHLAINDPSISAFLSNVPHGDIEAEYWLEIEAQSDKKAKNKIYKYWKKKRMNE